MGPIGGKPEAWKNTAEGKLENNKYTMCKKSILPLLKSLVKNRLSLEILNSLYIIVQYCMMKEYMKADDKYLALGIGNSPWPMGVTMVGIHERSGRSRIYTSQVAHVLNDETQRKYLQAYKRLMTICKEQYKRESDALLRNQAVLAVTTAQEAPEKLAATTNEAKK